MNSERNVPIVLVADVLDATAIVTGVERELLVGRRRQPRVVAARHLAMYVSREWLGKSYPKIGKLFGGRDHTTVLHGVKSIAARLDRQGIEAAVDQIIEVAMERSESRWSGKPLPLTHTMPVSKVEPPRLQATLCKLRRAAKGPAPKQFSDEWFAWNNARFAVGYTEAMMKAA